MLSLKFDETISADISENMRMGFDLVQVSQIEDSIEHFGEVFKHRLFTDMELDYADSGEGLCAERLAARFAAKEAVIKALKLSEAGISWREIEVLKLGDGSCEVLLHGRVADLAKKLSVTQIFLSLSHDGDYAGAVVAVLVEKPN
jgi:holo-[acyl-carrier protein] synthase